MHAKVVIIAKAMGTALRFATSTGLICEMPETATTTAVIGDTLRAMPAANCIGKSINTACMPSFSDTAGASAEKAKNGALPLPITIAETTFGTRMTYVEVFFNHEYWGLYALMEPVDSRQLDRTKEGEGAPEEYSYKSVTPQSEPTEELLSQEAWGETLSGYELKGVHSSIDRSAWEPLLSYLELRDLADDQEFAEKAPLLTDQEGALDVWIYLQAVLGIDNRGKNMYYVSKNRGNTQKIYFAPWDMDITWGDALSEGTEGKIWDVGLNTALYSERVNWSFGDRLIELDVEGSRSYVGERWKELRQGALSDESLTEAIEGLAAQVVDSGALARDQERWPDSNSGQDYVLFTRMALYRMKLLDYYFDGNLEEYLGLGYQ